MKPLKHLLLLAALAISSLGGAWAGTRTHVGIGMYFGAPVAPMYYYPRPYYSPFYPPGYGPYFGPPPLYGPPPVIVVPPAQPVSPPVYIEQSAGLPPADGPQSQNPQAQNFWYYCEAPQAYYPYVRDCPEGWLKVTPRTPAPQTPAPPPPAPSRP